MFSKPDPRYEGLCCTCRQATDPMWLSPTTGFVYCDSCRYRVANHHVLRKVV